MIQVDKFQLVQMKADEGIGQRGIATSSTSNVCYGRAFETLEAFIYFLSSEFKLGVGNYFVAFTQSDGVLQTSSFTVYKAEWIAYYAESHELEKFRNCCVQLVFRENGGIVGSLDIANMRDAELGAVAVMLDAMESNSATMTMSFAGINYQFKKSRVVEIHSDMRT